MNDACQTSRWGRLLSAAAACGLLGLAGCMQVDTHVKLNEDGGATITERLQFSRRLLELGGKEGSEWDIASLLKKEAALQRASQMGKGAQLVKHEVREAEGGAHESLAVYSIPDLNDFLYVSPWPAYVDYPSNGVVKWKLEPVYKSRPYAGAKAGQMAVSFHHLKSPKAEEPPPKGAPPSEGPVPREQQPFRELAPAFREMLKDLRFRITFETYAPIAQTAFGLRGRGAAPRSIDLLYLSDQQLDRFGVQFFENEEVIVDLIRRELGSATIVENVKNFASNDTLPVFLPLGSKNMWWLGSSEIGFKPSRALFDRHFVGKKLDYSEWQGSSPDKHVVADFDRIGYSKGSGK